MNAKQRTDLIQKKKSPASRPAHLLWCKGERRSFDVVRVPVDALMLYVDNRRFAAERKLMEEKLGHSLDPENSDDDEKSVISILLDSVTTLDVDGGVVTGKPSKDYEALRDDWQNRKQESPFWIRPDGTVRNGNRRLAMLKRMRAEQGLEGAEWVEAIILKEEEIDDQDLFEMEQAEQLTENFKVRYTDINLLQVLREAAMARRIDWHDRDSIDRVAGELQHLARGDKRYMIVQLGAIKYMDAYLRHIKATNQYHKLMRQVERFRDVGKIMAKIEEDYADEAPSVLKLCFSAITAGAPHGQIRTLGRMFIHDRARFGQLRAEIEKREKDHQETSLEEPDLGSTDDEDEDETDDLESTSDTPGPVVRGYPTDVVKAIITDSADAFATRDLPIASRLRQALDRLESVTRRREALLQAATSEEEVADLLQRLIVWAEQTKDMLDTSTAKPPTPPRPSGPQATAKRREGKGTDAGAPQRAGKTKAAKPSRQAASDTKTGTRGRGQRGRPT